MNDHPLLKVAIPNKGSLSEAAHTVLREAGYRVRTDSKELVLVDADNHVEFYYLRPRDIAVYVGGGTLDLGITGRDMLLDSGADAAVLMALGFGRSRFRFAAPKGTAYALADLHGKRIATSYPGLLSRYLAERGVVARLVHLDGAVESSIRLGVADAIADVVETGSTLRQAGLEVFGDTILDSEAVLIRRTDSAVDPGLVEHLQRRISGVLVARDYVLLDYDIDESNLEAACKLTPGLQGPTISPLARDGWVAVRALVPAKGTQNLMDQLWELGARGLLVTEVSACRL